MQNSTQDRILKKLSGSQKVSLGLELGEVIRQIARDGIRHQNPHLDPEEVKKELIRRLYPSLCSKLNLE